MAHVDSCQTQQEETPASTRQRHLRPGARVPLGCCRWCSRETSVLFRIDVSLKTTSVLWFGGCSLGVRDALQSIYARAAARSRLTTLKSAQVSSLLRESLLPTNIHTTFSLPLHLEVAARQHLTDHYHILSDSSVVTYSDSDIFILFYLLQNRLLSFIYWRIKK